jgi:hypothetical protein
MTFFRYKSVRRVLGTTLLLVGLSFMVSPELLAEEAPEQESQSSEEPTAVPTDDVPNDPLPVYGASGVDDELNAIIEELKATAFENREAGGADVWVESQVAEEVSEEEFQSSEEPAQDPPEDAPSEPLPTAGDSDRETGLDAMIEEAKVTALKNRESRAADVGPKSQEAGEPVDLSSRSSSRIPPTAETKAATVLGAVGGVLVVPILPTALCLAYATDYDALAGCLVLGLGTSVFGGMSGAYLGNKNVGLVVVGGGALSLGALGAVLGIDEGFGGVISGSLLGATAGGYLGYRIWRARESDGDRYSLLPYWDEERSGVMVSGRF